MYGSLGKKEKKFKAAVKAAVDGSGQRAVMVAESVASTNRARHVAVVASFSFAFDYAFLVALSISCLGSVLSISAGFSLFPHTMLHHLAPACISASVSCNLLPLASPLSPCALAHALFLSNRLPGGL